nr:globin-coupled sensor protein [Lysinibacillus timonensis]
MNIFTRKQTTKYLHNEIEKHIHHVKMDLNKQKHVLEQASSINLTLEDLAVAKAIQPYIEQNIDEIFTPLYNSPIDGIRRVLDLTPIGLDIERTKDYIIGFYNGVIDDVYVETKKRLGHYYLEAGVEIRWYLCTLQSLMTNSLDVLKEVFKEDKESLAHASYSISKIFSLETQLVLSALQEIQINTIETQELQTKQKMKQSIGSITEELAAMSQEAGTSVVDVIARLEDMKTELDEGLQSSIRTTEISQMGSQQLDQVIQQITILKDSVSGIKSSISELETNSREIGSIVEVITSIADQTNLLALNAAIEAARAGEHGKGFSVVANEVKKLAEQTKASSATITNLVGTTTKQIENVVNEINNVNSQTIAANQNVQETVSSFDEILSASIISKKQNERTNEEMMNFTAILKEIEEIGLKVAEVADQLNQTMQSY